MASAGKVDAKKLIAAKQRSQQSPKLKSHDFHRARGGYVQQNGLLPRVSAAVYRRADETFELEYKSDEDARPIASCGTTKLSGSLQNAMTLAALSWRNLFRGPAI
jgi:hypothetical protein